MGGDLTREGSLSLVMSAAAGEYLEGQSHPPVESHPRHQGV